MLKRISNILIISSILIYLIINFEEKIQKEKNRIIINNINYNSEIVNYYVGYISIKDLEIEVPLVYGTSKNELNQNLVGISKYSTIDHLILAGHAIKTVFLNLYDIKENTIIEIKINNNYYEYYVDKKYIVNENDLSIYNNTGLTLITCIDNNKRLIVHAKTT